MPRPHVLEGHPDRLVCPACAGAYPWPEWWTQGGVDGPPRCPGCGEATE
jgi:NAD-dependent SIR2 family protein deacetylase